MNKQRQILVTVTYNDLGCIIDTKAELYEEPNLQPTCNNLATDAISRQAAIDMLEKAMCEDGFRSETGLIHKTTAYEIIRHLPSAQQEIIHCGDCIHWINKHLCEIWSRYGTIETKPDFYCGFGERINNE